MKSRTSHFQYKSIFVLALLMLNINVQSQEKAYWQDLAHNNPAVIGANSDWFYTGYAFTNYDNILSGLIAGVDYELGPSVGTFGIIS